MDSIIKGSHLWVPKFDLTNFAQVCFGANADRPPPRPTKPRRHRGRVWETKWKCWADALELFENKEPSESLIQDTLFYTDECENMRHHYTLFRFNNNALVSLVILFEGATTQGGVSRADFKSPGASLMMSSGVAPRLSFCFGTNHQLFLCWYFSLEKRNPLISILYIYIYTSYYDISYIICHISYISIYYDINDISREVRSNRKESSEQV